MLNNLIDKTIFFVESNRVWNCIDNKFNLCNRLHLVITEFLTDLKKQ